MITSRPLEKEDLPTLELSLAKDEYHKDTSIGFFLKPGTVTNVYEDEYGEILYVRGIKTLRLDIQFVNNEDVERNKKAMLEGFDKLAAQALSNGFSEIVFQTDSKLLARFCKQHFGFVESQGELRKDLLA